MQTHIKVVAWLFIVFGVLGLIAAGVAGATFGAFAGLAGASGDEDAAIGMAVLGLTGVALTAMLVLFSLPSMICGWGLLKLRRWARILGIVLAAISVIQFPTGTLFGAYVLWVLFQKQSEALFEPPPRTA